MPRTRLRTYVRRPLTAALVAAPTLATPAVAVPFAMAAQLPGSVVLSREGDDYSMFLLSQCVRDATNRYLTTRALPAPGTTCTD